MSYLFTESAVPQSWLVWPLMMTWFTSITVNDVENWKQGHQQSYQASTCVTC